MIKKKTEKNVSTRLFCVIHMAERITNTLNQLGFLITIS